MVFMPLEMPFMPIALSPAKALIFRITHRDNVPWVLDNGLHCGSSKRLDPHYVEIGNPDLIEHRRDHRVPCPPGGTLGDYVPFYFTPFSPMLYNIKTGYNVRKRNMEEIVILVSSLHRLKECNAQFVFTDRHAYLATAVFDSNLAKLDNIDWPSLKRR